MDAQYPFASREDIWRVFEEVKDLYATQLEHGERIGRLERRRDDDARLRSFWGPWSPFPIPVGGAMQPESTFNPTADAFKGFDQGQQQGLINMGLDSEEEPRRGTCRANSVRFDERAIHGYYGQVNRSNSDLPLRTGSGLGSHPLTERSLSHRSDGRQSSSGHSHHSARTNSFGLEGSKLIASTNTSPSNVAVPPPGLFLLGPVPCIIRCWLNTNFSNDSLLYAVICSGSFSSFLCSPMIERLGLEDNVVQEDDVRYIKLPMYLPEASIHQASSRASSLTHQLPTLTIRFLVRDAAPSDKSIQIFIGSDILRSHNADILFSQDKIIMVDDERKKISIPLVRPENDAVFRYLSTTSDAYRVEPFSGHNRGVSPEIDGHVTPDAVSRPPATQAHESPSTSITTGPQEEVFEDNDKLQSTHSDSEELSLQEAKVKATASNEPTSALSVKPESSGVWGPWRRDSRADSGAIGMARSTRAMKVLRPSKSASSRTGSSGSLNASGGSEAASLLATDFGRQPSLASPTSPEIIHPTPSRSASLRSSDGPWTSKPRSANPVGGASAFGWLNSSSQAKSG